MVDVVMVDVAFKELTPSVENTVVPTLTLPAPPPLLPPAPGGKPLILETVRVDRTRSLDVMLDTDMINPVSIEMVNVDPVMVETDRVDVVMVEVAFKELTFSVEYSATPGAPLLILETVKVEIVI
jgi:hypothetical protein